MDHKLIDLEGERTPYTLDELSEEIIVKVRKGRKLRFKNYVEKIEFDLSAGFMNKEKRLSYAETALSSLRPTLSNSKLISAKKLKNDIEESIKFALEFENERPILWKSRYETLVESYIETCLIPFKIKYLNELLHNEQNDVISQNIEKIKWIRGVSEFGYMMIQLVEKQYIELPTGVNAEGSFEKFARLLFQTFDVTDSWASFKDALNSNRNRLSDIKRIKLEDFPMDFPVANELGTLKKKK